MERIVNKDVNLLLNFIHLAEKLKCTLRHGWTSSDRQESVAEHSWRVSLILLLIADSLDEKIDIERALKLAIIHDIIEVYTGDIPYFEAPEGSREKERKEQSEREAIAKIKACFGNSVGDMIYDLWYEYELGDTYEAKVVKAIDKIEALIQQNEAAPDTWVECEIDDALSQKIRKYCFFDSCLDDLAELVFDEAKGLIEDLSL